MQQIYSLNNFTAVGHAPCHQEQRARLTLCCHPRLCLWTNMKAGTL